MAVSSSKKSSTALTKVLPDSYNGIDFNFCRNPLCKSFAEHPYPYKMSSTQSPPSGYSVVADVAQNKSDYRHKCPDCWVSTVVKNNQAIYEEYDRQRRIRIHNPSTLSCKTETCAGFGRSVTVYPDQYRAYGRTKAGDPRHQCKLCKKTFSVGRPARRQKRSDKNKSIFEMLVNDTALSKICVLAGVSYTTLYNKIDYIYDRVRAFTSVREADLSQVRWSEYGSRFATDSQSLFINWPTKRRRTPVVVQHLCTAHARSGYIVAASIQFDPNTEISEIEAQMLAAGDFNKPIPFRSQSRVWSQQEFDEHIAALQPVALKQATPQLYQLPHKGSLVRADILHFAHALIVRDALRKSDARFMFVIDAEDSIRLAFVSVMADLIKNHEAQVAVVSFAKGMTNDKRNQAVAQGRSDLRAATGMSSAALDALPDEDFADLLDSTIAPMLVGVDLSKGFAWPFHTKSEPNRTIKLPAWDNAAPLDSQARLLRLSTLRAVDSYFHRFRSNVRFAQRAGRGSSSGGQSWDRYYLYKPDLLVKIAEVFRFHHNWMFVGKDKKTAAMRLGLAKGKIYARDVL